MAPGIDLYWLPLGAGGRFVRVNGRIYEAIVSRRDHRGPLDLFHTALEVTVPEGRFVIENAWPIPDRDGDARGVTVQGPVWSPRIARFRAFRYEVRRWHGGAIADIAEAVESPRRVSDDETTARRVLDLTADVPPLVWGRRVGRSAEMWNSNSVIAWLLARGGVELQDIQPPDHGRAPGWSTGIELADTVTALEAAVV
jgi:hypothetical protein